MGDVAGAAGGGAGRGTAAAGIVGWEREGGKVGGAAGRGNGGDGGLALSPPWREVSQSLSRHASYLDGFGGGEGIKLNPTDVRPGILFSFRLIHRRDVRY